MKKHPANDFDGFAVALFKDEDGDWMAHLQELPAVSAFGETPEEAMLELAAAWELVKESHAERGEPIPISPARRRYSGRFNVRIPADVHRRLATEAARQGVSLNALVNRKLAG